MIKRERDKSETEGRSAVQRENSKLERTTLGDIDALAQLKEQLSTDTPEKAKAKKAATKKEEANTDVETAETAETTEEKPKAVKKTTKKASKTSDDADASSDTNATSEVSNTEHTEEESSDN